MKEIHYFYVPDAGQSYELPEEEARHAAKVLRLTHGDEIILIDGKGTFHKAVITEIGPRRCCYDITESRRQSPTWCGHLHIAIAPTKNMERIEWLVEKAAEIGFDELSFVDCRFSERHTLRLDRVERIVVSAIKQSHKAFMPNINSMVPLGEFLGRGDLRGGRYIAHCLNDSTEYDVPRGDTLPFSHARRYYFPNVLAHGDTTVLIGPEGDFSTDELAAAMNVGFVPVSLGRSRLRTETAALFAVTVMNLKNALRYDGTTYAAGE